MQNSGVKWNNYLMKIIMWFGCSTNGHILFKFNKVCLHVTQCASMYASKGE